MCPVYCWTGPSFQVDVSESAEQQGSQSAFPVDWANVSKVGKNQGFYVEKYVQLLYEWQNVNTQFFYFAANA